MKRNLTIVSLLISLGCSNHQSPPAGDWYGTLGMPGITYRLYFNYSHQPPLINVTFKNNEVSLDTIYFKNDSLHFKLKEFYSEYTGYFDRSENRIKGQWISEDSLKYALEFVPAWGDTIRGLHPRNKPTYTYKQPEQLDDGIQTCSSSRQQVAVPVIDQLMKQIMDEKYPNIHSMLISRNNCLVVEEYFYSYHQNMHYGIQSATKSFVSALTGIAVSKGQIKSLNDPMCRYFKGYEDLACNAQNKSITLRDLISMKTGLAWDEVTYDYIDERNSNAIAYKSADPYRFLLSQSRSPNPSFAYNSYNHLIMNHVLKEATQMENIDEMNEQLLEPMGFKDYDLGKPDKGVIYDIFLRPRDMMKFGMLYLNEGNWNGKQLVPKEWVKESTSKQVEVSPSLGYGYFWWTTSFKWNETTVDSFFAWGWGGQYIFVVPELKLVVVFSGSNWSTDPKGFYFEMMEKYILSSVVNK